MSTEPEKIVGVEMTPRKCLGIAATIFTLLFAPFRFDALPMDYLFPAGRDRRLAYVVLAKQSGGSGYVHSLISFIEGIRVIRKIHSYFQVQVVVIKF